MKLLIYSGLAITDTEITALKIITDEEYIDFMKKLDSFGKHDIELSDNDSNEIYINKETYKSNLTVRHLSTFQAIELEGILGGTSIGSTFVFMLD